VHDIAAAEPSNGLARVIPHPWHCQRGRRRGVPVRWERSWLQCGREVCEREQDQVSSVVGVAGLSIRRERDAEFDRMVGQSLELIETMVQLEYNGRELQIGHIVGSCGHWASPSSWLSVSGASEARGSKLRRSS
jgi:hypothetical protein